MAISAHGMIVKRNGLPIAELGDVTLPTLQRKSIDQSLVGVDDDIYSPGHRLVGELIFNIGMLLTDASHLGLLIAYQDGTLDFWRIEFPDGARWGFRGHVVMMAPKAPVEGPLIAQVTVQVSQEFNLLIEDEFILLEDGGEILLEDGSGALILE